MGNRYRSRYGDIFVSFPSQIKEANLDYELVNFVLGDE